MKPIAIALVLLTLPWTVFAQGGDLGFAAQRNEGERLYASACATCHGADGSGAPAERALMREAVPDFTDCGFATREPDADWAAIISEGGPVRGFARMMPAFGAALTDAQIGRILEHVRSFCGSTAWPRGELNLPRPLVTEKAYPEDEAVFTTAADVWGSGAVLNKLVYERRFGARNQIELVVPFGWQDQDGNASAWSLGDVAVGVKRAVYHSLANGTIVSVTGEVRVPTGRESGGFGAGTAVLEPFVTFGKILPRDAFLQVQAGFEFPTAGARADEGFWRAALGRTFAQRGGLGRSWSPMIELLGARELTSGARTQWDLVPQVQVSLNTRQHVLASIGVRLPLTDAGPRDAQLLAYILWDWFDGGLFDGW